MSSIVLAFSVVCPLLLMMMLGYFLRQVGMLNEDFLKQLNKFCFTVFLPMILFINVYDSDFSSSFQPELIIFAVSSVIALFVGLMIVVPRFEMSDQRRGVIVQGIFRSNYILFGLPIAASLYGSDQTGTTAVLMSFVIPLFNLLSVVALEFYSGGKINFKKIVIGVFTNPLIIGAMVAFTFIISGLRMPLVLEETVRDIAAIASPLALIILGGNFAVSHIKPNLIPIFWGVCGKLILVPLCFLTLAILLGYRDGELAALIAMFAAPTAVSSFNMAQQMKADDVLAGQIVVVGSICSIVTIFIWISVLSSFGFLVTTL